MDLSKVRINPIAIKNYLFENNLVIDFTSEHILVNIKNEDDSIKPVTEVHLKVLLPNSTILDIHRKVVDKLLYVNDTVINNWEDLENYLINIT